jgi:hypothetical protein
MPLDDTQNQEIEAAYQASLANKTKSTQLSDTQNQEIEALYQQSLKSGEGPKGAVETVANWFIFLLIFVFDPLAITLVIATNQAFNQNRLKYNIYGEPKPTEPEPITPQTEPEPAYEGMPPSVEEEKQRILQQIRREENSGGSSRKKGIVLNELYNKLSSLDDNTKTY